MTHSGIVVAIEQGSDWHWIPIENPIMKAPMNIHDHAFRSFQNRPLLDFPLMSVMLNQFRKSIRIFFRRGILVLLVAFGIPFFFFGHSPKESWRIFPCQWYGNHDNDNNSYKDVWGIPWWGVWAMVTFCIGDMTCRGWVSRIHKWVCWKVRICIVGILARSIFLTRWSCGWSRGTVLLSSFESAIRTIFWVDMSVRLVFDDILYETIWTQHDFFHHHQQGSTVFHSL